MTDDLEERLDDLQDGTVDAADRMADRMNDEEAPEDRLERERVGVTGDPVPDHEYGDSREDLTPHVAPEEPPNAIAHKAREVATAGLLTEKQALAWLLRRRAGYHREAAASMMGISPSTLDTHLQRAAEQVQAARATLELLEPARQ